MDAKAGSRAVEQIVARLAEEYFQGEGSEGERLPGERALALRFRVSRATVREALRELAATGRIEKRKGSGTYVTRRPLNEERASPAAVLEARKLVEPFLAALAAARATSEEIGELEALVARADDPETPFEAYDDAFHLQIARLARNPLLEMMAEIFHNARANRLWGTMKERLLLRPGVRETYQRQHREVVERIAERDADAAAKAMRRHIERVYADMRDLSGGTV